MTAEIRWLHDTPEFDTVLARFLLNQSALNELIATAAGGRCARDEQVALADAGVPVPYLNQAVLRRPVSSAADPLLDTVDDFFRSSRHAATVLSIWPTPDLAARGWSLVGHPMFVVRAPGPHERPPRTAGEAGIEIELVDSAAGLADAEQVVVAGYPVPEAQLLPPNSMFPAGLLGGSMRVRVGLLAGEAVATGCGHVAHGLVNLCMGATLPAARRRGAWQSLVWARVDDAPESPAVAFTSDMSRPGFLRLGFLPITRFTLWELHPTSGSG